MGLMIPSTPSTRTSPAAASTPPAAPRPSIREPSQTAASETQRLSVGARRVGRPAVITIKRDHRLVPAVSTLTPGYGKDVAPADAWPDTLSTGRPASAAADDLRCRIMV